MAKLRKDHPNLQVIVGQDAISPNGPYIRSLKKHGFRPVNGLSINASHKDVQVNFLEYCQRCDKKEKYFTWVTDLTFIPEKLLSDSARWPRTVENRK